MQSKKVQQEKWFGAETIMVLELALKREMKWTDSAHFRGVRANHTDEFEVVACTPVNDTNAFGSYTGFLRFVSSDKGLII